jgi:hypothetical protein
MLVSFLSCPNSNANMTIQARYSPVTTQSGHTISNQIIILTFPPTNCTYIITIEHWYCKLRPLSRCKPAVLEITACSLQLPGQNIIIHGFSTPI